MRVKWWNFWIKANALEFSLHHFVLISTIFYHLTLIQWLKWVGNGCQSFHTQFLPFLSFLYHSMAKWWWNEGNYRMSFIWWWMILEQSNFCHIGRQGYQVYAYSISHFHIIQLHFSLILSSFICRWIWTIKFLPYREAGVSSLRLLHFSFPHHSTSFKTHSILIYMLMNLNNQIFAI